MRSTSAADGGVVAADAALALPGELERGGRCLRCERGGTCRSCGQRRRRAWRLVVVEGLSYREAGERMGLTPERVRLLVGQERDHRDLDTVQAELRRDRECARVRGARAPARSGADPRETRRVHRDAADRPRAATRVRAAQERQLSAADRGCRGQPADDRPRPRPARARRLLNHPRARLPHRPARRRALPGTRRPWPRRPAGLGGCLTDSEERAARKSSRCEGAWGRVPGTWASGGPIAAFGR